MSNRRSSNSNSNSNNVKDDPYRALNLPHTATREEIRRSYKQLAKKYHPDTWSAPCFTSAERDRATRVFQGVSDAFALLDDRDRKADYDRNHALGLYPDHGRGERGRDKNEDTAAVPPPLVRPPSRGAPPPLPSGWTTATDPSSGSLYYCHVSSGRSSWTHPLLENIDDDDGGGRHVNGGWNTGAAATEGGGFGSNPAGGGKRRFPRRSVGATAPPAYHGDGYYSNDYGRNVRTTGEPDRHRCGAFLALWLCPPLGILALYHSIMVGRCWTKRATSAGDPSNADGYAGDEPKIDDPWKHYGDLAHGHSKRAGAWACLGNTLGILVWGYLLLGREDSGFEWPQEWDLEEWWPDDWDFGGDP